MLAEAKQVEQVTQSRAVGRNVGIAYGNRIGEIVSAAGGQWLPPPIPFDEFQDRNVVGIGVVDVIAFSEAGNDDQWNARPVAKEVQRLHIT